MYRLYRYAFHIYIYIYYIYTDAYLYASKALLQFFFKASESFVNLLSNHRQSFGMPWTDPTRLGVHYDILWCRSSQGWMYLQCRCIGGVNSHRYLSYLTPVQISSRWCEVQPSPWGVVLAQLSAVKLWSETEIYYIARFWEWEKQISQFVDGKVVCYKCNFKVRVVSAWHAM